MTPSGHALAVGTYGTPTLPPPLCEKCTTDTCEDLGAMTSRITHYSCFLTLE